MSNSSFAVLRAACDRAGIKASNAQPLRTGENAVYRLSGGIIARIGRSGQGSAAQREIDVARWLARQGINVVIPLEIAQPLDVGGNPVTFWHELPDHRHAKPEEIGAALRRLHDLPIPVDLRLGALAPFVRLADRIEGAAALAESERAWLTGQLGDLRRRYLELPPTRPHCVVHGDAWAGNVVVTDAGEMIFLDLERCSVGPPEWDLVSTAIKFTSFAAISADEYGAFCERYGVDVTQWEGFELLRDIRELRMCTYVAQLASGSLPAKHEAELRIGCLRGEHGPRPWTWTAF